MKTNKIIYAYILNTYPTYALEYRVGSKLRLNPYNS